ncbi:MAG TPA: glycosyltransferase [Pyrinomonadaceae bacterium]|nr:glycosyltransferase [Pyrinomonadaceae bacterium]
MDKGGSERQFIEFAKGIDKSRFEVHVATFYGGGQFQPELEDLAGVSLSVFKEDRSSKAFSSLFQLWSLARRIRPQVLIGYLNLPAIFCSLVGSVIGGRVIWCLRSSEVHYEKYGRGMRWSFKAGAYLARTADLIVLNSTAGKIYHCANGYHGDRMIVIPNGIDTSRFRPDPKAGAAFRQAWGIRESERAIGLVGRLDHMKDHPTFLRAAAKLASRHPELKFVCIGGGPPDYAAQLKSLAAELRLDDRMIWTGDQKEMTAAYNALDLLVSSSSGEGFSNVIAEAMAAGVPAIVSDVGDSALIIGETGLTFPAGDPDRLAAAVENFLAMSAERSVELKTEVRQRIEREFAVEVMVKRMEEVILDLVAMKEASQHVAAKSTLTAN